MSVRRGCGEVGFRPVERAVRVGVIKWCCCTACFMLYLFCFVFLTDRSVRDVCLGYIASCNPCFKFDATPRFRELVRRVRCLLIPSPPFFVGGAKPVRVSPLVESQARAEDVASAVGRCCVAPCVVATSEYRYPCLHKASCQVGKWGCTDVVMRSTC